MNVLQEWVGENCSLREQGVLLLALRGPDGARKEAGVKNLVRALRACVMRTGYTGQPLAPGENLPDDSFMQMYRIGHVSDEPWREACREFFREWDTYNVHWLFHFMHACQVLGFRYPGGRPGGIIQGRWRDLYMRCCEKLHINPENLVQMSDRLKDGHKLDEPE